jgi:hypothetical protein
MTLFDTDRHSIDRNNPNPNHHDKVAVESLKAHGTESVNFLTDASNTTLSAGGKNGQFTIVQSDIILLGINVELASTPGAGIFKAFRNVTIAFVPHNLPFIPVVTGVAVTTSGLTYKQMPFSDNNYDTPTTSALWVNLKFSADATYVYVSADGMVWGGGWSLAPGWTFKYFAEYQTSN